MNSDQKQSQKAGHCRRCGTCCAKGGPAFHQVDKALIEKGVIPAKHLYTIRIGEPVMDNVRGEKGFALSEMIKIKGRDGSWTCCFFDDAKCHCTIYDNRPIECRELKCWDTRSLEQIYDKNRLNRKDLLSDVKDLWVLIEEHERLCPYGRLNEFLVPASQHNETAADAVLSMVAYDMHLRDVLVEKGGVDSEMTDFLFGRPLTETIKAFGVRVEQNGEKIVLKPAITGR